MSAIAVTPYKRSNSTNSSMFRFEWPIVKSFGLPMIHSSICSAPRVRSFVTSNVLQVVWERVRAIQLNPISVSFIGRFIRTAQSKPQVQLRKRCHVLLRDHAFLVIDEFQRMVASNLECISSECQSTISSAASSGMLSMSSNSPAIGSR